MKKKIVILGSVSVLILLAGLAIMLKILDRCRSLSVNPIAADASPVLPPAHFIFFFTLRD